MKLYGGCLCGSVRYGIDARLIDAGYCHCRICQRSSGAPLLAWMTIAIDGFTYTQGKPAVFQSSEHCHREFCAACGTQLVFRKSIDPHTIDITLGSLDDCRSVKPQYHIWVQSKVDWLQISDGLPQYDDAGPDSHCAPSPTVGYEL